MRLNPVSLCRMLSVRNRCSVKEAAELSLGSLKPYDALPSPKGLPLIGTAIELIRGGGATKLHEYCDRRHKELGPIFREKLGPMDVVVVSNKEYTQKVYMSEGRFPVHFLPEAWVIYNEKRGIKRGLFFMDGDHWRKRRMLLNKLLMTREVTSQQADTFNGIVTDVLERWSKLTEKTVDRILPNLETELYNWSIESVSTMVFGRRIGCVMPAEYESQMHEFVRNVKQIFVESAALAIIPPKLASTIRLPVWRRFEKAADKSLEMARVYVEERIAEIKDLKASGIEVGGVLAQLLTVEDTTTTEIVNIAADLILAAADTTSHSTQWALYSLAKNPECQERLVSEIKAVVPPGEVIAECHINKIPYLSWIIKETLRLYPIASFLTRIVPNKIALGGYEIPAGQLFFMSQYTTGRDPEQFSEPEKFTPERWKRTKGVMRPHACMPFGFGIRSCIGRNIAELKMQLLISRVVQQFHLESANEKDVGIILRMITTADQPIKIRLKKRNM